MAILNCKSCGKIFNATLASSKICPDCKNKDTENFKKVKDYLYKNKGASIPMTSEETGVTVKDIMRYLREDRLEVADNANIGIPCERCGVNMKSGKYCLKCISEMESILKGSVKQDAQPLKKAASSSSKMFTADMRRK